MDAAEGIESISTLSPQGAARVRGVGWVLRWAAAVAAWATSLALLVEFGYCLSAERALVRAAQAGAWEATLPRATCRSVERAVQRHLRQRPQLAHAVQLSVRQNGTSQAGVLRPMAGDRLSVSLAVPSHTVIPTWLRALVAWPSIERIEAHAERRMPGPGFPAG